MRARPPQHGRDHRPGGTDPIPFEAAAASAIKQASYTQSGPFNVATATPTHVGFDDGAIYTDFPSIFTTDLNGGLGIYGIGIFEPGEYLGWFTAQAQDTIGAPVANPETFVVSADDVVGAGETVTGTLLGSNYGRGFTNNSGRSEWDVSWARTFFIDPDTTGLPIDLLVGHTTGVTLKVYTNAYVEKISESVS